MQNATLRAVARRSLWPPTLALAPYLLHQSGPWAYPICGNLLLDATSNDRRKARDRHIFLFQCVALGCCRRPNIQLRYRAGICGHWRERFSHILRRRLGGDAGRRASMQTRFGVGTRVSENYFLITNAKGPDWRPGPRSIKERRR